MRIADLMTRRVDTISTHAAVSDAASRMRQRNVGFLVVREGAKAVGTLTERDIVVRAVARRLPLEAATASEVMSAGMATVPVDADVRTAMRVMRERRGWRVVVVDGGKHLAGVLSLWDLAAHAEDPGVSRTLVREIAETGRVVAAGGDAR